MNYRKIYDAIINRAKSRQLKGYKERHHVIPRCMGGKDDADNLVDLTAREHFLCHWILARLYPENHKIVFAFWAMCNQRSRAQRRYIPSSRIYQEGREAFIQIRKGIPRPDFTGINHPSFGKPGYWKGKKNPVHAEKMKGEKNHNYGKITKSSFLPGDCNIKYWKGRVGPNAGLSGSLNWNSKGVVQQTKQGVFVASYGSVCEAERVTGIRNANIVQCCKGKLKTAGGFVWVYSNSH